MESKIKDMMAVIVLIAAFMLGMFVGMKFERLLMEDELIIKRLEIEKKKLEIEILKSHGWSE